MARREHHAHGSFAWLELEAGDPEAAARFYGELLGWRFRPVGDALEVSLEGDVIALVSRAGDAPRWRSCITVSDATRVADTARTLGAAVGEARVDPALGVRVAITDPDGAALSLWQPGGAARGVRQNEAGALAWNELWVADVERAFAFYAALIGWGRASPPGAGGEYLLLTSPQTPAWTNGGLRRSPGRAAACWLPYFEVVDCDAAVALTVARGGSIVSPAVTIPSVGRIAAVHDPGGVALGFMTSAVAAGT